MRDILRVNSKINSARLSLISIVTVCLFSVTGNVSAETYHATSSKHPVGLIELYTSQGCSSCPPAEKWLGNLERTGVNKEKAVPLALHVDYWDYIGWKDQFSQKYFTKRQYRYRSLGHSPSIYTPQIMFNGKDARRASLDRSFNELKKATAEVAFKVSATEVGEDSLDVKIDFNRIDNRAKNSQVIVVLAENNLVGNIKAGENEGRSLKHRHVVRLWKNIGGVKNQLTTRLNIKKEWKKKDLELVVIVETPDMQTQQALQLALR